MACWGLFAQPAADSSGPRSERGGLRLRIYDLRGATRRPEMRNKYDAPPFPRAPGRAPGRRLVGRPLSPHSGALLSFGGHARIRGYSGAKLAFGGYARVRVLNSHSGAARIRGRQLAGAPAAQRNPVASPLGAPSTFAGASVILARSKIFIARSALGLLRCVGRDAPFMPGAPRVWDRAALVESRRACGATASSALLADHNSPPCCRS